ncbi:hypothetical protein RMHFA_04223 [Roseomonas mucosa]|uniref:Uncharacterized protein n=1 Tax=Roseomonas mucosa TaxID=207340 RepID=A0A4Y1MV02_9PROT|nr:hypothetical protein RADP37_04223 [Roseomonas mucosa]UZO96136.1 hypothetical protein RMHFA_04223 [Roseomonas mucosa]
MGCGGLAPDTAGGARRSAGVPPVGAWGSEAGFVGLAERHGAGGMCRPIPAGQGIRPCGLFYRFSVLGF